MDDMQRRRRLFESSSSAEHHHHDIEHVLSLASRAIEDVFTEGAATMATTCHHSCVLFVVRTLSEYDKGTRGTTVGADRLKDLVVPILVDGVSSNKGDGMLTSI